MLPCVPPRAERHELPDLRAAEPVEGMLGCLVDPVTGLIPVLLRELLAQARELIPDRPFRPAHRAPQHGCAGARRAPDRSRG